MPVLPRVHIVSPALASANNGNWHTARRWQAFLAGRSRVAVTLAWNDDAPADVLIALHARRSAESIRAFHDRHPRRPLVLVLTGTDLYRDIARDPQAAHSLALATHIVVLQEAALAELDPAARAKARVIVQSAPALRSSTQARRTFDLVAVGHLREEKDPRTMQQAVRLLPAESRIRFVHVGNPLDDALAQAARETMRACPRYRWLGGLPQPAARRWIARARALVHASRMEGGANVVIEAVRASVPVLASAIPGNLGLLGADYPGCFTVGDAPALADLMLRCERSPEFVATLAGHCAARAPLFAPARERDAVRALVAEALAATGWDPSPPRMDPPTE